MISIWTGLMGCLEGDTKIDTAIGYLNINELRVHHPAIKTIDSSGNVIFIKEYKVIDSGIKDKVSVCFSDTEIICSPEHKWICYDGENIIEITAKELIEYETKKSEWREKCNLEKCRFEFNKGIISKQNINGDYCKETECFRRCNSFTIKDSKHSITNNARAMSIFKQARDVEKRYVWNSESVLQKWKEYRSEEKPKRIHTINWKDLRILRLRTNDNEIESDLQISSSSQQKQSGRKCNDIMPTLSCEVAYVTPMLGQSKMYDIHVPKYECFVLKNGIITHNSGKTASMVRFIALNQQDVMTYTNIIIKKSIKNVVQINKDMIIKKEIARVDKNGKKYYNLSLNADFWKEQSKGKGVNLVLDEAHTILDSRRSMSKVNKIMNDFMALLRRILGGDGSNSLTLISQLGRKLDVNARELATSVHWHKCHYLKTCQKCKTSIKEDNEREPKIRNCPKCNGFNFKKHNVYIEKWEFRNMEDLDAWRDLGMHTYYRHYFITDIEKYFPLYNTLQWENLISDYDEDDM
jgi:hypothetical protein